MKLVKPSIKLIKQGESVDDMYEHIEKAGRICYASEPKGNAKEFVDRLINSGHGSVLEHGTVYMFCFNDGYHSIAELYNKYNNNKYSRVVTDSEGSAYITTNFRVIVENDWYNDMLTYGCKPMDDHIKRISIKANCDIGVTRECNRHRSFSISEQSTRYCNYSKDKFGNEITFIEPCWPIDTFAGDIYKIALHNAEKSYMQLINQGWKPQQARLILPLNTASEIMYTAFEEDWEHFFKLRCRPNAHPQAQEIANMIKEQMYGKA